MQFPAEIVQHGADPVSHTEQYCALSNKLYSFRYLKVSCQTVVGTWECQHITKKKKVTVLKILQHLQFTGMQCSPSDISSILGYRNFPVGAFCHSRHK